MLWNALAKVSTKYPTLGSCIDNEQIFPSPKHSQIVMQTCQTLVVVYILIPRCVQEPGTEAGNFMSCSSSSSETSLEGLAGPEMGCIVYYCGTEGNSLLHHLWNWQNRTITTFLAN